MRVLRMALAGLLLAAFGGTVAQASHVFWVDANDGEAFENPVGAGNLPAGWTNWTAGVVTDTVANGGRVSEGDQSAKIPGGQGGVGITRQDTFHDSGEYHWMFYDDMAVAKNGRVGLDRTATFPNNAPRFAAIAVETNQSLTHYMWHHSFSFGATTVPRSLGWHEMYLKWDVVQDIAGPVTRVQYYIDQVLGATRFYGGVFTPTAEWIGAPFGTSSPSWVDIIPEPSALSLLGIGMVGLFMSRRRSG